MSRTPRAISREEMIRVIREFTEDKDSRSGLGFYFWAPVEYDCTCGRFGGKAFVFDEDLDLDMIIAELEPVEFNVQVTDLGERFRLSIEQTTPGFFIDEEDEAVYQAILEKEVEIEKNSTWGNGDDLRFTVAVELDQIGESLDDLSDDQLKAAFDEVTALRPDLLEDAPVTP